MQNDVEDSEPETSLRVLGNSEEHVPQATGFMPQPWPFAGHQTIHYKQNSSQPMIGCIIGTESRAFVLTPIHLPS